MCDGYSLIIIQHNSELCSSVLAVLIMVHSLVPFLQLGFRSLYDFLLFINLL